MNMRKGLLAFASTILLNFGGCSSVDEQEASPTIEASSIIGVNENQCDNPGILRAIQTFEYSCYENPILEIDGVLDVKWCIRDLLAETYKCDPERLDRIINANF